MRGRGVLTAIAAALMLVAGTPVCAAEDDVRTRLQDLEKKLQGYEQLRQEVERLKAQVRAGEEAEKQRAEAKSAAPALPEWVKKITPFGDLRVRNESFFRDGDPDRVRQRFRLRLGAKVAVNEEAEVGFRLASGTADDPISNNQSFTDVFTFKDLAISAGYLKVAPAKSVGTARPYFTLMGGKFDVPFYAASKLVWDGDATPEGFYEAIHVVSEKEGLLRQLQLNFGQWVFQEISSRSDGAVFAFQGLVGLAPSDRVAVNLGVADYVFHKPSTIATERNSNLSLVVSNNVRLEDGSILGGRRIDPTKDGLIGAFVSDFNELNVGADVTMKTGMPRWPVKVFGDYVVNTEAEGSDDTGFVAGAGIGNTKEPGDLNFVYAYERLETDAVVSTFTDSDFGRDGATNTKGHILQLNYVLLKGLQFTSTAWITEPVEGVTGRNSNTDYRWQVDMMAKF